MTFTAQGSFVPVLAKSLCIGCSRCWQACSGKEAFGSSETLLGSVAGVWVGYASDSVIRLCGASGGSASAIVVGLLESQHIDAAVICRPHDNQPGRPVSFIARNRDEVLRGAKSMYAMSEIGTALRQALDDDSVSRIAVVGLPCQLASLKHALRRSPGLRSKLFVTIGLMEGHNVFQQATCLAIKKEGFQNDHVSEYVYRASGWCPPSLLSRLVQQDGSQYDFPWKGSAFATIWDASLMIPKRCLVCNDFAAESSDIALADAWLQEFEGDERGQSILLAHTRHGSEIIQELITSRRLVLRPASCEVIGRSQYMQLDHKKRTVAARVRLLGLSNQLDCESAWRLSAEDWVIEAFRILRNAIAVRIPFSIWQLCNPRAIDRYLERLLSRGTALCLKLSQRGNRIMWKRQVQFDSTILSETLGGTQGIRQ